MTGTNPLQIYDTGIYINSYGLSVLGELIQLHWFVTYLAVTH